MSGRNFSLTDHLSAFVDQQVASGRGAGATEEAEGGVEVTDDDIELVHGGGNVFRDLGLPNPDLEQLRAILAAKIIGVLDERGLTIRKAQELTGIAAADFSRIRQAKLDRFTVDRLMNILDRLGQEVVMEIQVRPRPAAARPAAA